MTSQQLANLRRKRAYYTQEAPAWVRNVWPRPQSFDWFIKNRRDDLVAQGALIKLGRDYFVDVALFPVVAGGMLGVGDVERISGHAS